MTWIASVIPNGASGTKPFERECIVPNHDAIGEHMVEGDLRFLESPHNKDVGGTRAKIVNLKMLR
ncbi:MAG: hypothetical protein GDYSWBUE_001644 [Candidatus Fervidibacterota bacterium]